MSTSEERAKQIAKNLCFFGRYGTETRDQATARHNQACREAADFIEAAAAEVAGLRADAERYRWLREQDWFSGELCVLRDPKNVLTRGNGLGADCPSRVRLDAAIDAALSTTASVTQPESAAAECTKPGSGRATTGSMKLWLWKNFVDGKPGYLAFDNPYPVHLDCGDPQTLGEPCGYAVFKPSRNGRPEVSEADVLRRIEASKKDGA